MPEACESEGVAGDAVVRVVPSHLVPKCAVLLAHGQVPVIAAPECDDAQRSREATRCRLPVYRPAPSSCLPPVVPEPKEVEVPDVPRIYASGLLEAHETGLLWM